MTTDLGPVRATREKKTIIINKVSDIVKVAHPKSVVFVFLI